MIRDRLIFTTFVTEVIPIKTRSSSDALQALGRGNVTAMIGKKLVTLENCLYVPTILQQLISLVRLIKSAITISKEDRTFSISQNDEVMFEGGVGDNLLYVSYQSASAFVSR
jgi:hypothetical protein